jgi:hypothetical protein
MSTYKTGNPLGSAAVKDLYDNAENLDFALNSLTALIWTDRLGKTAPPSLGWRHHFSIRWRVMITDRSLLPIRKIASSNSW